MSTLQPEARERVLLDIFACRYAAAADILLGSTRQALESRSSDSDQLWPELFALAQTLLLAGKRDELSLFLIEITNRIPKMDTKVHAVQQLAMFFHLVERGSKVEVLQDILQGLEVIDKQLKGELRSGVLSARASLEQLCGRFADAVETLGRAWVSGHSKGGFCPAEIACFVSALELQRQEIESAADWVELIDSDRLHSRRCCRSRFLMAQSRVAVAKGYSLELSADLRELVENLPNLECPELVVEASDVVIRSLIHNRLYSSLDSAELAVLSKCEQSAHGVEPSEEKRLVRDLTFIDLELSRAGSELGVAIQFEWRNNGITARSGPPVGSPEDADARIGTQYQNKLNTALDSTEKRASELDRLYGSTWRSELVAERRSLLTELTDIQGSVGLR